MKDLQNKINLKFSDIEKINKELGYLQNLRKKNEEFIKEIKQDAGFKEKVKKNIKILI